MGSDYQFLISAYLFTLQDCCPTGTIKIAVMGHLLQML